MRAKKREPGVYGKQWLRVLYAAGANVVTLPEMFICPYDVENFRTCAEEEGGPVWQRCSDIARKKHIYLSAGTIPERDADGRIYNTAYFFDPEGRQIAKHRKMHLFDIDVKGGQYFKGILGTVCGAISYGF